MSPQDEARAKELDPEWYAAWCARRDEDQAAIERIRSLGNEFADAMWPKGQD